MKSTPLALPDELAQNTVALARVLDALISLSEEQRRAVNEVDEAQRRAANEVHEDHVSTLYRLLEARLQAIFDERQATMKTLAALLHHRQQWRDAVQRLLDVTDVTQTDSLRHNEKAHLLARLVRDDAMLSAKARQAQQITHEAETALRSTVQGVGAQLKAQRQRANVLRAYHPPSPPPRFVDRVNVL